MHWRIFLPSLAIRTALVWSFSTNERFRGTGNKARHFISTLTWADGTQLQVSLNQNADLREPERVRYLPQHFIEDLCNEIATGNETNFGRELRKVIFLHVPDEKRLGMGTLDELLDYLIKARRQAFAQVRQSLRTLNESIVRNEQEMSADTLKSYQRALALKQSELDAIDKIPIAVVDKPPEDPTDAKSMGVMKEIEEKKTELGKLRRDLEQAKNERQILMARLATLNRLVGHVDNFEASHKTFVEEHRKEFDTAKFSIDEIVNVTINRAPLVESMADLTSGLGVLHALIDGREATGTEAAVIGLEPLVAGCAEAITKLQEGLDAPQKAYQAYLKELEVRDSRWAAILGAADKPETIEYFTDRIKRSNGGDSAGVDQTSRRTAQPCPQVALGTVGDAQLTSSCTLRSRRLHWTQRRLRTPLSLNLTLRWQPLGLRVTF